MIYCFGDSHASLYSGQDKISQYWPNKWGDKDPRFRSCNLSARLAYNLNNPSHYFRLDLGAILSRIEKGSQIAVILGEIDCRMHIYQNAVKNEITLLESIDNCLNNYIDGLFQIERMGFSVAVQEPTIVCKQEAIFATDLSWNKVHITALMFAQRLRERLRNTTIKVFGITNLFVQNKWYLDKTYYRDMEHLSQKCLPYMVESMKEVGINV